VGDSRAVSVCLAAVALSLLLVGGVSGTLIRHSIQIAPIVAALIVSLRSPATGAQAGMPIFAFWLLIMALIWLFLLHIARAVSGHFSSAEIALTVAIGMASLWGSFAASRVSRDSSVAARSAIYALFLALQFAAMWLSVQPSFARR
jgi:hypothetical protein